MKTKKYTLDIPNPCHKKWDEMTPNEKGRFCQSCQTTVVDFSTKSNPQIAKIIQESKGKICGRFRKDQLDKVIEAPRPLYSNFAFKAASVLITSLLTSFSVNAQVPISVIDKVHELSAESKNEQQAITSCVIKGKGVDSESGERIIFGSVMIQGTEIGAETDFDGNYELNIPKAYFDQEIVLEFSYVGYERLTKNIVINHEQITVDYKLESSVVGGIVSVGYVVPNKYEETEQTKNSCIIKGKAVDKDSDEPIIYGSIMIQGTEIGAETDFDGNYELKIPSAYLNQEIVLEFSYVGYSTGTVNVVIDKEQINVDYKFETACCFHVVGGMSIISIETTKEKTLYQWIKYKIENFIFSAYERQEKRADRKAKRLAKKEAEESRSEAALIERNEQKETTNEEIILVSIFPNPSSSDIYITTNFDKAKKLDIGFFTLDGKLVYQQDQEVLKGKQTFNLNLKNQLPPATYILRMNDGKDFLFSEQIIFQKEN